MDISYSSLSTYKSCHKKYYWRYERSLEPKREGVEVSTGKAIHEAFELYFKGSSIIDCTKHIISRFNDSISNCNNPWELEDLTVNKYVALGMWEFYPFDQVKFDKLYPEQQFKVRIPNTDINLVGYLDGLVLDNGKYWIREVKTTGNVEQAKARADVSYQTTGYVWAMQQVLKEKVHGVFYDIIRKPLLRKNSLETANDFAERCYKFYADKKNHQKLYSRHYSYRSKGAVGLFLEDLSIDLQEIEQSALNQRFGRNPDSCFMYSRECPYKRVCFMDEPDQDLLEALYDKRVRKTEEAQVEKANGEI